MLSKVDHLDHSYQASQTNLWSLDRIGLDRVDPIGSVNLALGCFDLYIAWWPVFTINLHTINLWWWWRWWWWWWQWRWRWWSLLCACIIVCHQQSERVVPTGRSSTRSWWGQPLCILTAVKLVSKNPETLYYRRLFVFVWISMFIFHLLTYYFYCSSSVWIWDTK